MTEFVTTGDIARILDCPLHRVTYAVQRLRIAEDARAGTYRLFKRDRLEAISDSIRALGESKNSEVCTGV